MRGVSARSRGCFDGEQDWEFFLPDDEETHPEPGDFWIDSNWEEEEF